MKNTKGFTLSEVLITLVIIGVVAAITVPVMNSNANEQATVAKVKKMYSIISQVVREYQFENNCQDNLADCMKTETFEDNNFYKALEKHLNYNKVVYPGENLSPISYTLPITAKNIDGSTITKHWLGLYDRGTAVKGTYAGCAYYALLDGSVMNVQVPDNKKNSGLIFFDTNGQKGPNQIGKDQFPIGIGAYNNEQFANTVHPYFNEDDESGGNPLNGLCNITNNHECSSDVCTKESCSPTAYVLKHNTLPKF